jgi:hypothetical protein
MAFLAARSEGRKEGDGRNDLRREALSARTSPPEVQGNTANHGPWCSQPAPGAFLCAQLRRAHPYL